jgi:hypothetical protein
MKSVILGRVVLVAIALLATPALADLRSFFHGDPPPFVKAPPPKQLAAVSSVAGMQPDPQVESFMRTLANAVMARDGAMLLPRLSERYAIDGVPDGAKASEFMVQAIGKMPGPTQIVIQSVELNGAVRIAKAEFHYLPERTSVRTFRFDSNGNLLSCDLFSVARA